MVYISEVGGERSYPCHLDVLFPSQKSTPTFRIIIFGVLIVLFIFLVFVLLRLLALLSKSRDKKDGKTREEEKNNSKLSWIFDEK